MFSLKLVLNIGNSEQMACVIYSGSQYYSFRNTVVALMMSVSWWAPSCTGLELNGMSCADKGETPPPLPVKGSTADYGNLLDNQDLMSPSTPPPPPPHQRVGVLIRSERSSLMMHGTHNETRGHYILDIRVCLFTVPQHWTSCAKVCAFMSGWILHSCLCLYCICASSL